MAKLLKNAFCALFSLIAICFLVPAQATQSDNNMALFDTQLDKFNTIETIIKENNRCIRCHKKERLLSGTEAIYSVGKHTSEEFRNNCTACHGVKGEHPKDDATNSVIPFDDGHHSLTVWEQNKQCIECHTPSTLRQSEWTHDVHGDQISCSSCHNMHTESDPIVGINKKFRIGLCATCHEKIDVDKLNSKRPKSRGGL